MGEPGWTRLPAPCDRLGRRGASGPGRSGDRTAPSYPEHPLWQVAFAEARRDDGDVVLGVVGVEALEASSTSSSAGSRTEPEVGQPGERDVEVLAAPLDQPVGEGTEGVGGGDGAGDGLVAADTGASAGPAGWLDEVGGAVGGEDQGRQMPGAGEGGGAGAGSTWTPSSPVTR